MNYEEALSYIHSVSWKGSRPGLSRTRELLAMLGNPEKGMHFLHIAGTNGKGSVCSMCDSVLRQAGYNVGLYTSPFIVNFNERMCVGGKPIGDSELASVTEYVRPFADSMADKPTEFELITVIAFVWFKRRNCDIVVLETGMGGRLDSTNVIESSEASVITGIALDHVEFLGHTVEAIASEKAGIIKPGCPVVYGGRDDAAFGVIEQRARECHSALTRTKLQSLTVTEYGLDGTVFDYGCRKNLRLSLCGSYQPENAATAIEAMDALACRGYKISDSSLRLGLEKASWRARFELLSRNPVVIYDGSHNDQGVRAAAESIKLCFGDEKVILLMGVLADKDYDGMTSILAPLVSRVFAVTPDSPRALNAAGLAEVFSTKGVRSEAFSTVYSGVDAAYKEAVKSGKPLIMLGSLYMYGEAYGAFCRISEG